MIEVFVSSTFRDLEAERQQLLDKLNGALDGVGMEKFVPLGKPSQETAIEKLRENDAAIFLISPYYGSFIEKCNIQDCKAECGVNDGSEKISYTHCEYKIAQAEGKPYLAYIVDKHWEIVNELNKMKKLEWDKIWDNKIFDGLSSKEITHYHEVTERVLDFKKEVNTRFSPRIKNVDDIEAISEHLAQNIVSWYSKGKINLMDFCGRRKELKDLLDKMDDSVEVYGVGGIGKTTLIQVALLIQKLKGKKIISVGTMQSYSTGSGYRPFKKKCRDSQKEILGEVISMDDIFDALSIPVELIPTDSRKKIKVVSDKLVSENTILFIDDFHLADDNVKELVKVSGNIVLSSKKKTGVLKNEMPLHGIDMEDRDKLIDLISKNKNKNLSAAAKAKIKQIAEGVPVSTEILIKNYEKIDFDEIEDYKKNGLDLSKPEDAEEFNKRVVKEVLSEKAFELIKNISVLNTDLEDNIDRQALKKTYPTDFDELFNELIDTDMLDKNNEGTYRFKYRHVQEVLREDDKEKHEKAIEYYKNKKQTNDNAVEILYHLSKSSPDIKLIDRFILLCGKLKPVHYGFRRLIDDGNLLRTLFEGNDKARIYVTLGNLYSDLKRYEGAEEAYNEALEIYKELAVKSPDAYRSYVAMTQNNLAVLYKDLQRFEGAEEAYNEALEIYKELAVKSPDAYWPNVANTQNNLAVLYKDLQRFEGAEEAYNEALEIRKKLAVKSPDAYRPDVANTQNNLAVLYKDLQRFEEAEKVYNEALEIYKELAVKSPDAYLSYVANIQNNLANLHTILKRFEDAEEAYNEALEIYKELAVKSPDAHLSYVANTQNNLANLYKNLQRFEEAEKVYNEAFEIYKELAVKSPDAYLSYVANIQNNLANLHTILKRFEDAEEAYNEALEIYKELAVKSPDAYRPYVAMTQNNLANLYTILKRFEGAEEAYNEALEIRKELTVKSPDAYLPALLETQVNIGMLYFNIDRIEDGISALENTLKRKDLLPDFGAISFAGLGNGYEILNNTKDATMNFMMASASYFLLFRKGIPCLGDVIKYLDKVVKLGEGEMKGDAELIITAITRLAGQETALPEGDFSKRGEALREAFNGNIVEIKPENEIDLMFMHLINDIYQSSVKPTNHS